MLADEYMRRVVIVDTSNEIGGDGDVPHTGIGRARRMQVPNVNMQHNVSANLNLLARSFNLFCIVKLAKFSLLGDITYVVPFGRL